MKIEAEIGIFQPQAREHLEPPEARSSKEGFFPRAYGRSMALESLGFGLSLQDCERMNFHCFKPPHLVTWAALETHRKMMLV